MQKAWLQWPGAVRLSMTLWRHMLCHFGALADLYSGVFLCLRAGHQPWRDPSQRGQGHPGLSLGLREGCLEEVNASGPSSFQVFFGHTHSLLIF